METTPNNGEVADIFSKLADYLEIAGENAFKTRAYRNAAETLRTMHEPVSKLAAEGRLADVEGFGSAIVAKTQDILKTGTTAAYEKMRVAIPEGVLSFLELPGIGPKTVQQIWEGLNVESIDALEKAAIEGRVRKVKGMSAKTEEKILDSIARMRRYKGSVLADAGDEIATSLVHSLASHGVVASVAGQIRRGTDCVSSIDLVAASDQATLALAAFTGLAQISKVVSVGETSARVILSRGVEASLTVASPEQFGLAMVAATGSQRHFDQLSELAASRGASLTRDRLIVDGVKVELASEDDLYAFLGLTTILPTLREGRGEVAAAIAGTLPGVVTLADYRGNLHQHTTASDGHNSIAEMAAAGKERGYEYMSVTDHSKALAMTNGLTPERLRAQIIEVREAEQSAGIRIFAGSEVDILADGSLDFDDALLAELDIVVASVHSRFSQSPEEMTARVLKAVSNPNLDILGHPTGRLINSREPFAVDMDKVITLAASNGTALEINAFPDRLDMNEVYARQAAEAGAWISINTDAHRVWHLDLLKYGINIAQRAWIAPRSVVNTRPYDKVVSWLAR